MKCVQQLAVIFFTVWLSAFALGCGAVSFHVFDPKGESVKTIGVLTVPGPQRYFVNDAASPARMLGALGPAGQAGAMEIEERMNEKFISAIRSEGFDFGAEMSSGVTQRLERAGFRVVPIQVTRAEPNKLLSDYSGVPAAGVDAFLDIVWPRVGYFNPPSGDSGLRPVLDANLQLVSAKTRNVLYSEAVSFGYPRARAITYLPAKKQYYFKDFDALMANTPLAMEGMKSVTGAIGDLFVGRLSATPPAPAP